MIKHISIIAPEDSAGMAITGPMDIFFKAINIYKDLNDSDKSIQTKVELVGIHSRNVKAHNNVIIQCHKKISEVRKTDLIIIAPIDGDFERKIKENKNLVTWLKNKYSQGSHIGSFCNGAFFLAATGLLDGKEATTHWHSVDQFRKMFPKVILRETNIITDEGRLFCSGGATSFVNFCIYLVEKYFGKETAMLTSKTLLIDPNKIPQNAYAIFSTQKFHSDKEILEAQNFIENNFAGDISVIDILEKVHISKRNFFRRFKIATGNTPLEYLQRVRIEAVKKGLETQSKTIREVIYDCGYTDNSSFRKLFKKYAGITPSKYKEIFNLPKLHNSQFANG